MSIEKDDDFGEKNGSPVTQERRYGTIEEGRENKTHHGRVDEKSPLHGGPSTSSEETSPVTLTTSAGVIPEPPHNSPPPPEDDEDQPVYYPEGGKAAWLVVFGSWCALCAALGTLNTLAGFQAYISANQLAGTDPSTIGWIFSIFAFCTFALGIVIGPVFDKYGAKWLIRAGTVGVCASMLLIGLCEKYWHFLLVFSILGGISSSLLFTPSVAAPGHWFHARRGLATGLATTGGAIGGIITPLMLQKLIPSVGFAWATRIIGFVYIVLCGVGCLLIRSRLPPAPNATSKPDFRILADPAFALTVGAIFLLEWGIFIPLTYVSSYALYQGFDTSFAFYVLMYLNAGSFFGRWMPGFFADKLGRFNTMVLTTVLTVISVLCVWLPAGHSQAGLIVFCVMFGFASGSTIGLTPVCVGQLCRTENYGRYYATCYSMVSIGCLTGVPIAGQIVVSEGGKYWGLIIFTGVCYAAATVMFIFARTIKTGWKLNHKF